MNSANLLQAVVLFSKDDRYEMIAVNKNVLRWTRHTVAPSALPLNRI